MDPAAASKLQESEAEVIKAFERMATGAIDEKGISPLPMVSMNKEGVLEVGAMLLSTDEIMTAFMRKIVKRQVDVIMVGRDCMTRPGQGTEFKDVLVCLFWSAQSDWTEPGEWRKWFKVAVLNYQFEPLIVRPLDWENEFWTRAMKREIEDIKMLRNTPMGQVEL